MESALNPTLIDIDGLDLSNYFRDPSSHNPVVYIHKRNLKRTYTENKAVTTPLLHHKSQQVDPKKILQDVNFTPNNKKDLLIENTIRFARDLIPLTMPLKENESINPIYYTIDASKKTKTHRCFNCKTVDGKEHHNTKVIKNNYKKTKRKDDNNKTKSVSHSSENTNNTFEDISNRTMSGLSETSERNETAEYSLENKKKQDLKKIVSSDSVEAVAAQCSDSTKIKIQLMNEKERNTLYENIHAPLVKGIKECICQMRTNFYDDMNVVRKAVETNSNKLDTILEKMQNIEENLGELKNRNKKSVIEKTKLKRTQLTKSSKLEELGEDIAVANHDVSSEDDQINIYPRKPEKFDIIESLQEVSENLGQGEIYPENFKASTSNLVKSHASTNKIPARFCWTESK